MFPAQTLPRIRGSTSDEMSGAAPPMVDALRRVRRRLCGKRSCWKSRIRSEAPDDVNHRTSRGGSGGSPYPVQRRITQERVPTASKADHAT